MNNLIKIAKQSLLEPGGLTESDLIKTLENILGNNIDHADLYFQSSHFESWLLEDGIVKDASYNVERGVGVRAISGEKTGFAYSDDIVLPALTSAADAAKSIAKRGDAGSVKAWGDTNALSLYAAQDPLSSLTADEKVALLQKLDAVARAEDPCVSQVMVSLAGVYEVVLIVDLVILVYQQF